MAAVRGNSQLLFSSYRHVRNKVNKLNNELKRPYFSEKSTLKKSFDSVDHRILCDKRKLNGDQQRELSWL